MKKPLLIVLALVMALPLELVVGCKSSPTTTSQMHVPTTFVFTTQPAGAIVGAPFATQPVVAVTDPYGNVSGWTGAVTLSITPGTGVSGATLSGTLTVNAISGIATFTNLSIDTVGSGYSLTATSGSLIPASSNPFNVSAVSATPTGS
jgi:hypothetical protein